VEKDAQTRMHIPTFYPETVPTDEYEVMESVQDDSSSMGNVAAATHNVTSLDDRDPIPSNQSTAGDNPANQSSSLPDGERINVSSNSSDISKMTCMLDFLSARSSSSRQSVQENVEDGAVAVTVHQYTRLTYKVERVTVTPTGVEDIKTLSVTQQQIDH